MAPEHDTFNFLHETRDLMILRRFPTIRGLQNESVAEHSYYTSLYALLLADMEVESGKTVDYAKLLRMCLIHDIAEVRISDIPRPVKHANPRVNEEMDILAEQAYSSLVRSLPSFSSERFMKSWRDMRSRTFESKLYKAADLLEALVWVVEEDLMGRRNAKRLGVAEQLVQEITKIGLPSANKIAFDLLSEVNKP